MSGWTDEELRALEQIGEIGVAGRRQDGSARTLVTIWGVVVDGKLYIRSVRGADGGWYQGVMRHREGTLAWNGETRNVAYVPDDSADDLIDQAYFQKYGTGDSSRMITRPSARATTLRVEPR